MRVSLHGQEYGGDETRSCMCVCLHSGFVSCREVPFLMEEDEKRGDQI